MGLPNARLAYADIIEQFVNDGAFLWVLREVAHTQPNYSVADLLELETRIQQQLDAMFAEPELAWELICEALAFEEPGEVFVAAVFAFRSMEVDKIKQAVDAGLRTPETQRGLVSAMAWLPLRMIDSWLQKFYSSKNFDHKIIALAVSAARREDPGEKLTRIFERDDCLQLQPLRIQALRTAAELKRTDLINQVRTGVMGDDDDVRFWSLWAVILLGAREEVEQLKAFVLNDGPHRDEAIQLAFRALKRDMAHEWIKQLIDTPENKRAGIKAMAVLGDPSAITWLINTMRETECAQLAGEAFSMITGIDLEEHELTIPVPDLEESLPESDDEAPELDEDENLPWPDADKITVVWQKYGNRYSVEQRYLMGKELCPQYFSFFDSNTHPIKAMKQPAGGFLQRQRRAAAIEMALNSADTPFIDVKAKVLS